MTPLVFLWENFGPTHADRCDAVAKAGHGVVGLELYGRSNVYDWVPEGRESFEKVTLFPKSRPTGLQLLAALARFRFRRGKAVWFLCHYDQTMILLFALMLRLWGDSVFTMADSKYDDIPRHLHRELGKRLFMLPYHGAIGAGARSRDYLRFLGVPAKRIAGAVDALSLARIRALANAPPAPEGLGHAKRHFTIVARLVPKKNHAMALRAYALYCAQTEAPRALHLCGSGPLEAELRALAAELGIAKRVVFHGFVQTEAIAERLAETLALILPSVEEQFGMVVSEAQAMGLPVLVSPRCGAVDGLVRNGVNGFLVEPDNPDGLAWFMGLLDCDAALWRRMCLAAQSFAQKGDVAAFVAAVEQLLAPDTATQDRTDG